MIDSHCHPQFPQYDSDREETIKRALDNNIQIICVGTDLEMSQKAIELAEKYDGPPSPDGFGRAGIWATIGLHPNESFKFEILNFKTLIKKPKVVAIGEVGLDYYRVKELEKQKLQKEIFKKFIDLAIETKLPLIIHCRDAHKDMFELLSSISSRLSSAPGVIHSFTGNWSEARQYIDLGFYIGLNGIITFSEEYNEMVGQIPLEKILLETDAPYLAPPPYRGKRNEPSYVKYVAEKIAEIKNESIEKIIEATTKNAKELFRI